MHDETVQPIQLQAMTLHGIGSYLMPTRMEIRPLTILCGANGSGKSTWIKTLSMLCESQRRRLLPFGFAEEDWDVENIRHSNAFLHQELEDDEYDRLRRDADFGPPFTVGLECITTKRICEDRPARNSDEMSAPQKFFWCGELEKNTQVDIRLCHPSHWSDDTSITKLEHLIEFVIGGKHRIRFSKLRDVDVRVSRKKGHRSHEKTRHPYELEMSASLLPGLDASHELTPIARFMESQNEAIEIEPSFNFRLPPDFGADDLVHQAIRCVKDMLDHVLRGKFFVGAVRRPTTIKTLSDRESNEMDVSLISRRHVGNEGEHSWFLERHYAYNLMHQPTEESQDYLLESFVSWWLRHLVDTRIVLKEDVFYKDLRSLGDHINAGVVPNGFLHVRWPEPVSPDNFDSQADADIEKCDEDQENLSRLLNKCLSGKHGSPQPPSQMSAGFHQVFPMIVQAGLMSQCELMTVENPEVHLHPSLQLSLAEFFIQQAKAGKVIVLETHSDLIIRRVIREILDEAIGIGQEAVRIYFTDTTQQYRGYHFSTLKSLAVDAQGRIANWPDGFMDDDAKESRRLLDTLYGSPTDDEWGEDG